jgi:hypothetical protein
MRKISGILLYLLIISSCANAAYIALKNGKEGRIDVHDTTAIYNSKKSYFYAVTSKGEFLLGKRSIKYLVMNKDTLFFSGNEVQIVHAVPGVDTLSVNVTSDSSLSLKKIAGISDSTIVDLSNGTKININETTAALSIMLDSCDRIGRGGATLFWLGFGLNYGLAAPAGAVSFFKWIISGTFFGDSSDHSYKQGFHFSLVTNRVAKAMMITGAAYCGTGASLAFKSGKPYIPGMRKNGNIGFYRAGLITEATSTALLLAALFADPNDQQGDVGPLLWGTIFVLGSVSNVMFITSTTIASIYTGHTVSELKKKTIEVQIHPAVSYSSKSAGLAFTISF